jgi:hypothetical protein
MGNDELALATKCAGDVTVEPAVGDVTVTPAKAAEVEARVRITAHNKFLTGITSLQKIV